MRKKSGLKNPILKKRKTNVEKIRDHYLKTVVNSVDPETLKKRMGVNNDCEIHINTPKNIKAEIPNGTK